MCQAPRAARRAKAGPTPFSVEGDGLGLIAAAQVQRTAPSAMERHSRKAWNPCLRRVRAHIDRVQTRLGLRMLLENPATHVEFAASTLDEPGFLAEV